MELSRIAAHLIYIGTTCIDLGAVTIFFYTFEQREKLYTILDAYTGHRMNNTYVRIGGLYADVDEKVAGLVAEFLDGFPAKIDEIEQLLDRQPHLVRPQQGRRSDFGKDQAQAWSLSGPNLRASGCEFDLRQAQPYSGYENYDFEIPVGTVGDCYDRYLVRIEEMRQSVKICRQALEGLKRTRGQDVLVEDRRYVLPPKSRRDEVDGRADLPVQGRHRHAPAARRGLPRDRVSEGRARLLRALRRQLQQAAALPHPLTEL